MNDDEIKKALSILDLFYHTKDHQALLQASQDQNLDPLVRSYASGLLLRPWLPWGKGRKLFLFFLIAVIFFLIAAYQSPLLLFLLVIPFSFSPRIAGEVSLFIGKFSRGVK